MKPLEIKSILVPFNFKTSYMASLKMAVEIAEKSNATISLLYTFDSFEKEKSDYIKDVINPVNPLNDSDIDELKKAINNFIKDHGLFLRSYKLYFDTNSLITSIYELNEKLSFDLIIIPDHGKSAFDRLFADINALELMNLTKSAVIAVPDKSTIDQIKRIILPIRNTKNWHEKLPCTMAIAKITGANVYILGVGNTISERVIKQIKMKVDVCKKRFLFDEIPHSIEFSFNHGDPSYDVHNLALYKHADLIVVNPPESKTKLKSYLNESLYTKLMESGNIPIMGVSLS